MQSYKIGSIPFIAALVISVACGLIAALGHEGNASLLLCLMGGALLGFVFPRGAWRWAVILALWIPVLLALKAMPASTSTYAWCPAVQSRLAPAWTILFIPFIAVFIGVAIDWLLSETLRWLEFLNWHWVPLVKPVLRIAAVVIAVLIVVGSGFMLVQPLHPYSIGESYCWDEYCFAIVNVKRAKTIGSRHNHAVARGMFYIVTADMETPWWGRFVWSNDAVYATDYAGTDYRYSPAGQHASDTMMKSRRSTCHEILGAGETETIVFDLPENVVQPRLLVRDTLGFEGFLGGIRSNLFYIKPAFNLRFD
jgi:hypothetical protein